MSMITIILSFGIAAIYLGFAGVMGVLLHRIRGSHQNTPRGLAALHGILVMLPATVVILAFEGWPSWISLGLFAAGVTTVMLGAIQPSWTPAKLWSLAFGQRYFAAAMLLAALWGISLAWLTPALVPGAVAAAALAAAFTSMTKAPRWS